VKIIKGDLIELALEGQFDYIIHGANCFCTMGAGVAEQIAKTFPDAAAEDRGSRKGDIFKLGDYTLTLEEARNRHLFKVVNGYTQYHPGPDFQAFALTSVLYKLRIKERLNPQTLVGVPWIGCGIGGSRKEVVLPIFKEFARHVNLTIVEFVPKIMKK
jgi:O-acetyl-ADP-ribose deacetylase (regulator of RNase III)